MSILAIVEYSIDNITFTHERIMSKEDLRRYAAVTNGRILSYQKAERIGIVEVDEMYGELIFSDVYRVEDGRLVLVDGTALTPYQMLNVEPINLADEEEIII